MKNRTLVRVILLLLVAAGIGRWVWKEFAQPEPPTVTTTAGVRPDGVTLISLHGEKRCRTCIQIGQLAHDEIERSFAAELADGRLHWDNINYEQAEHRELIERYGLVSSTLVVTRWENGQEVGWKRLDEVWDLTGEEVPYRAFINKQVTEMLKGS